MRYDNKTINKLVIFESITNPMVKNMTLRNVFVTNEPFTLETFSSFINILRTCVRSFLFM